MTRPLVSIGKRIGGFERADGQPEDAGEPQDCILVHVPNRFSMSLTPGAARELAHSLLSAARMLDPARDEFPARAQVVDGAQP